MQNVILVPHTDDAVFSMGNWLDSLEDVLIISVMAGIPSDFKGRNKHVKLREEHSAACELYGVKHIEGDFLDDVYPGISRDAVSTWLSAVIPARCLTYVPLGIHHPDHILLRDICVKNFRIDYFYEELPYRMLYPKLAEQLRKELIPSTAKLWTALDSEIKHKGVETYASQIKGGTILKSLYVDERLWKL